MIGLIGEAGASGVIAGDLPLTISAVPFSGGWCVPFSTGASFSTLFCNNNVMFKQLLVEEDN